MKPAQIVTYGTEVLRKPAQDVEKIDDEVKNLIEKMYVAMEQYRGVGLAAPQIGVSRRVFVYDVGEGRHALINPKIVRRKGEEVATEGCLSIPGLQGEVPRALYVTAVGLDENGDKVKIRAEGLLARVFQHEIDHLDGMMFVDRADPATLETVPVGDEVGSEG
jgi:peptide deformylase